MFGPGIQGSDRAPVGVGRSRKWDGLDALAVLDGLGFADGEDHAMLDPGNVPPGKDLD